MAETFNLGKVMMTPRGAYSSQATYEPLDIVTYNGSSYLVLRTTTGVVPSEQGNNYQLIASKGATGETGQSSSVSIGTVTTLDAGQEATVTNSGTALNPVFNFGIPRGAQGLPGRPTIVTTVTIPASAWVGSDATVPCADMTADATVIVAPSPQTYTESMNAGIYCSAQAAGELTFTCINDVPVTDVSENVMIFQ